MALSTFSSLGSLIKTKTSGGSLPPVIWLKFNNGDTVTTSTFTNYGSIGNLTGLGLAYAPSIVTTSLPTANSTGCAYFNSAGVQMNFSVNIPTTSTNMTMSFWLKTTYTGRYIIFQLNGTGNAGSVRIEAWNINQASLTMGNIGNDTIQYAQSPDNTWVHWALVYTGSSYQVYKNGVAVSPNQSVAFTSLSPNNNTYLFQMISSGYGFVGYMYDVRVYTTNLTSAQINTIYTTS